MTTGSQELWWQSPTGEWFWRASDDNWYRAETHPTGVPGTLVSGTNGLSSGAESGAETGVAGPASVTSHPEPWLVDTPADPWEVARGAQRVGDIWSPPQVAPPEADQEGRGARPGLSARRLVEAVRRLPWALLALLVRSPVDDQATTRRRQAFLITLGAVVLLGLALRLCYVIFAQPGIPLGYRNGDAVYYQLEGGSIQHGLGFANPTFYLKNLAVGHFVEPDAEYAPMTALVLAGADVLGFTTYFSHQILWCLIGTLTIAVLALAAREIAGDAVGIVAGIVAALYPGLWINDGMVESETLLELAVAVLLYLSFRFWRRPSAALAAAVGVAAGLAAMSRAEAVLFVPFLVLPLALTAREQVTGRKRTKRRILYAAVSCGVCVFVMAPWVMRNAMVFDRPVLALDEGQTFGGANDTLTYYGGDIGGWDITSVISRPAPLGDPSDQDDALQKIAIDYAEAHKGRIPVVVAARFARAWGLMPATVLGADALEARQRWASTWGLAMFYLMIIPSIVTVAELRWWRITVIPLVAPILVVTVTAVIFYGDERLRADAEPALVLAATITSTSWSDLPTMFRNVRRGLSPRRLLGMERGSVATGDGEERAGPAPAGGGTGAGGSPWGAAGDTATSLEILPVRQGYEPSFRWRPLGGIAVAVFAAALAFVVALSYVDATGKADFQPRSGLHMAQLLLDEQLSDQVTRVQYETVGHFNWKIGVGTQYVTTGKPALTYKVVTANSWKCSPFPDLVSNVTITWPGAEKPLKAAVGGLSPLSFVPVPPVSCL